MPRPCGTDPVFYHDHPEPGSASRHNFTSQGRHLFPPEEPGKSGLAGASYDSMELLNWDLCYSGHHYSDLPHQS